MINVIALLVEQAPFPGASFLATALNKTVEAVSLATDNLDNCRALVFLLQACDAAMCRSDLARLREHDAFVTKLTDSVNEVGRIVEVFCVGKNVVQRLYLAKRDAEAFEAAHKQLVDAMVAVSLLLAVTPPALPPPAYTEPPPSHLLEAVCRLGKSDDRTVAYANLDRDGRLGELMPFLSDEMKLVYDIIVSQGLKFMADHNASQADKVDNMAPFLHEWWEEAIDDLDTRVQGTVFLLGLVKWYRKNR